MRHKASTGREVLAFLESNDLEATPSNYRLGYVFVTAGCNRLVQEINGYIDDKLRIKQANMDDMMERLGAEIWLPCVGSVSDEVVLLACIANRI